MANIKFCTYCVPSSILASKRCMQCETSLCDIHLTCHNNNTPNHILIDPTSSPDEWQCSEHKEVLKHYCKRDSIGICETCYIHGEHKGHSVEDIHDVAVREKEKLKSGIKKLKEKKQEKEKLIKHLDYVKKDQIGKTNAVSKKISTEIGNVVQQLRTILSKVQSENTKKSNATLQSFTEVTKTLEEQNTELSNRIGPLEDLCEKNNFTFLKKIKEADLSRIHNGMDGKLQYIRFDETVLSEMLHKELLQLSDGVIKRMLQNSFPKMKKSPITLDINSAYYKISITADLKHAYCAENGHTRGVGLDRFRTSHVLSECKFSSGNHYWEVEVKGTQCSIGVAYNNIERQRTKKRYARIGYNRRSWALSVEDGLSVRHNRVKTKISTDSPVRSFGIFLEYEAGRLSFYQLCDPIRHLHTFPAIFTRPLHAAFFVGENSRIEIQN